ncbi:HAD family hydrolase [Clostridium paridis]|uniref:HAD family phosphatase n=1 Tax=Clostridium paridis TaxID=2803863 RepID=A0A937K2K7_9CLOT|nr:HAD family phosphatase [Clostridium paridis]MBL4930747.1 HAD family phosphatase [Clostridium paridis]
MNNTELVIFDMDGLMFDTEIISARAWYEAGQAYGYELDKDFLFGFIGMNVNSIGNEFRKAYGDEFSFDEVNKFQKEKLENILDNEGFEIKKGLLEILDYLDEKKIKKAVATSSGRVKATKLISKAGVLDRFDTIVCGDEVTKGKPDPEIFLKACSKLNVAPENALVLEDSERGLLAANAGNIKCLVIPDLIEISNENRHLASSILESLIDIKELDLI